jgi:hypothetical protein
LDVKRSGKVLMMFTGVFGFDARLSSFWGTKMARSIGSIRSC